MLRFRHTVIAAAGIALLGLSGAIYESRIAHGLRTQLHELRERQQKLTVELALVSHQNQENGRELAAAQSQLAALISSGPVGTPAEQAIAAETQEWFTHLQTVKQIFAAQPQLAIPEVAQLTDLQWLLTTKKIQLDTPDQIRQGLAAVRNAAKNRFALQMGSAIKRYLAATNGQLPPSPSALAPYFIPPIDPAVLERYESLHTGSVADLAVPPGGPLVVIREKSPVDEDYDSRFAVESNGFSRSLGAGARAWLPDPDGYDGMVRKARIQFGLANNGAKAAGLEQLAPYISPPLPPEKLQKLIDLDREQKR